MWDEWITNVLEDVARRGVARRLRSVESRDGRTAVVDGRIVILACGNGYLGLAHDPEVVAAAHEAAARWGASSEASRFISGDHPLHRELEAECAALVGTETAMVVGSGYLANVGLLRAMGEGAVIASDERNHASIVDGCRIARPARLAVFRHADPDAAREALGRDSRERVLLITESLFSVDGDLAPLADLGTVARERGALFVVDEAHAIGTTGPGGRGGLAAAGIPGGADAVVGTLGKALGSYGAFIGCSVRLREVLVNRLRTAIYSTALPPAVLAASLAAVRILRREPDRVDRLRRNAGLLRARLAQAGVTVGGEPHSPILPIVAGGNAGATALAARLLEAGVLAPALRPPTVPQGEARIRVSVSALHTEHDIDRIAEAVQQSLGAEVESLGTARGGRS